MKYDLGLKKTSTSSTRSIANGATGGILPKHLKESYKTL